MEWRRDQGDHAEARCGHAASYRSFGFESNFSHPLSHLLFPFLFQFTPSIYPARARQRRVRPYIPPKGWGGGGYFALIHGGWVDSYADTTKKVTRKATVALSAEEQRAQNLRVDSLACALCSFPFTRLPQDTSDGLTRTFPLEDPSWRRTLMRRAPRKAPKVP